MSVKLPYPLAMLQRGESHDPFSVLGRQPDGDDTLIRAFLPAAEEIELAEDLLFDRGEDPVAAFAAHFRDATGRSGVGHVCARRTRSYPTLLRSTGLLSTLRAPSRACNRHGRNATGPSPSTN